MSLALAHETEHRSLSVLIVEDHRLVGEGLEVALRLDGFAPILSACESAEAVIEEGRRLAPDLVILDLQLANVGNGCALIRPLVAMGATVLVLTGVTDRIQIAMCLEAGATGVVNKAGSFTALLEQVQRAARGDSVTPVTERAILHRGVAPAPAGQRARTAPFAALSHREARSTRHDRGGHVRSRDGQRVVRIGGHRADPDPLDPSEARRELTT